MMAERAPLSDSDEDSQILSNIGGGFRKRKENVNDISISDFRNPWNFYSVFSQDNSFVVKWCVRHGLLPERIPCVSKGNACDGVMKLSQRSGRATGYTLRCNKNRNHECASRRFSFFERSKLTIPDVMVFIKTYLEGHTLYQCSQMSGVSYRSTSVDWGSFVREIFKEHFQQNIRNKVLTGEIEIDESLFGRRVKHHRGNPKAGVKIWVFGLVERTTNTVILYPVKDRTQKTLIPIILRHVQPGATIYSDGWSAYCDLNELGYKHFTVIHKYTFKSQYRNVATGDIVTVHTNRIEGAWKHAKDHFKKMSGTKLQQFEGHLAEVMWRSQFKGNVYVPFFDMMKQVFHLQGPPSFTYERPLFDTWSGNSAETDTDADITTWEVVPTLTDVESETETSGQTSQSDAEVHELPRAQSEPIMISSASDTPFTCGQQGTKPKTTARKTVSLRTRQYLSELFSASDSSDDEADVTINADAQPKACTSAQTPSPKQVHSKLRLKVRKKPVTSVPKPPQKHTKMRTDKVCHPKGFTEVNPHKKDSRKATDKNPYGRDAFKWSSSDSDFM